MTFLEHLLHGRHVGGLRLRHQHGGRVVNAQEKLYFITQVHNYD